MAMLLYIKPRLALVLRPVLPSLLLSGLVTFFAIVRASGALPGFGVWFPGWLSAWILAFPALLFAQPIVTPLCPRINHQANRIRIPMS